MARQEILRINEDKIKLETTATKEFNKIFKNIANDVKNIYRQQGYINSIEVAKNYRPEFLKEIRDVMRKTIKFFGFDLRKQLELKYNLFFDAEFKKQFIDFERKIKIVDQNLDPKAEDVNNEFLLASLLFIANQSEKQADYITETNAKEIDLAIRQENQNPSLTTDLLAFNIAINLLNKRQARSELISSQVVGLSEAWARQTESEIIDKTNLQVVKPSLELPVAKPLKQIKTWWAILDTKTRDSHAKADQQRVGVNDYFNINGEQAKYPRDPNLSAGESINCRCVAHYSFE